MTTTTTTRHCPRVARALGRLDRLFSDNGWPSNRAPVGALEVLEGVRTLSLGLPEAKTVAEALRWYGRTYGRYYGDRGFPRLTAAAVAAGVTPEEGTTLGRQGSWRDGGTVHDSLADGRRQHGWA